MYDGRTDEETELSEICKTVRRLLRQHDYTRCEQVIFEAMSKYPHAPEPHNLTGILLEQKGNRVAAMKHFRAACSLDPAYLPARHNLSLYGSFQENGSYAFDESDCAADSPANLTESDRISGKTQGGQV